MARLVKCPFCKNQDEKEGMIHQSDRYWHEDCLIEFQRQQENKKQQVKVKCRFCGKKDSKAIMELDEKYRRFHHYECKRKDDQNKEYKKLYEKFLIEIYDIKIVPDSLAIMLNKLISTTGVDYRTIYEAYRMSEDSILWSLSNKDFKNVNAKLRYGYKIMLDKINDVYEQRKIEKQKEMAEKRAESQVRLASTTNDDSLHTPQIIHKKKDEMDISDFI